MTRIQRIVEAVKRAGGETFAVGGSLRDEFLGLESKDCDLMVRLVQLDVLKHVLPGRVDLVGESFSVLKVTIEGETIDVALPRVERSTGAGHRDFHIVGDHSLAVEADLGRRDLTVNAMARNLESGVLVDPFGGMDDIRAKLIRAVGDPAERFREDPLRMLRAVRFVAKTGFQIEPATFRAISDNISLLDTVASERIVDELLRTLAYDNADFVLASLRAMRDSGILARVCPPFAASFGFEQHNPHHTMTVDEHVFDAVRHAVQHGASLRARLAVLLHDIGKPATFTRGDDSKGHFYEHDNVGAEMVKSWMTERRFPVDLTQAVTLIVREHLRPPADPSDKVLRRYVAALGDVWDDALACREADLAAHAGGAEKAILWAKEIRSRIAELPAHVTGFNEHSLAASGGDIAKRFGVKGKAIGDMKRAAAQAVIDGILANEPDAVMEWLASNHAA